MTAPSLLGMPASVITEFCSYLLPNKYSWGEKCISPELVALATTCRLLSEHALDVLWKELPSVVPLILTMPSDLIGWSTESYKHTTGRDAEVEVLSFRRPLVPTDYARLMQYAVRVKTMDYHFNHRYPRRVRARATIDVWRALREFRPMAELLPNLNKLAWVWCMDSDNDQEGPGALPLLAGSNLHEVEMYYTSLGLDEDATDLPLPGSIADACADFLCRLSRMTRNVQTFKINVLGQPPPISSRLSSFVSTTQNLTTFASRDVPLHPQAFLHLAHIPSLHTLAVRLCREDWSEEWAGGLPELHGKCFYALRKLDFQMNDANMCISVIKLIRHCGLQSLSLVLTSGQLVKDVAKCLAILPERPFALQLRKLRLVVSLTSTPPPIMYTADLVPLFGLDLDEVTIWGCEIAISNELVREMSEAWPNIVKLDLTDREGANSPYVVTVPGLLPFVYNCPLLQELHLNIDATNLAFPHPIPEIRPAFGSEQRALRSLWTGYGLISDPFFVAGFLADCFPECEQVISSWRGQYSDYPDSNQRVQAALWDGVWHLLKHFAKVRAQERHGAAAAGMKLREPANPAAVLHYAELLQSNPAEASRIATVQGRW
ncbi:hypothetical protein OH76DRAFT_1479846 [Lentinus brumalis]|uniref:F-box domain-containing protein n=1 Tax=Lentinus brumalis TaxID=2498619 RepID=A0A371DLJ2_9APHY|nr:hypothetical protein OH76DRAFT_1479846 [Polyporus brumalis]